MGDDGGDCSGGGGGGCDSGGSCGGCDSGGSWGGDYGMTNLETGALGHCGRRVVSSSTDTQTRIPSVAIYVTNLALYGALVYGFYRSYGVGAAVGVGIIVLVIVSAYKLFLWYYEL